MSSVMYTLKSFYSSLNSSGFSSSLLSERECLFMCAFVISSWLRWPEISPELFHSENKLRWTFLITSESPLFIRNLTPSFHRNNPLRRRPRAKMVAMDSQCEGGMELAETREAKASAPSPESERQRNTVKSPFKGSLDLKSIKTNPNEVSHSKCVDFRSRLICVQE